jgi:4-amino-4-deoxy-L-arabinose transferase-like glycosyltransferase
MEKRVLILVAAVYCTGLVAIAAIPLFDPDEGRYATIARNMAVSGDWVTPRVMMEGELVPFLGKPPLAFWLGAASMRAFGVNEFAARLPSFLSAVTLLTLMWLVLRRSDGSRIAAAAVLLTASLPLFFVLSGVVVVDMVLTFFVVGALLAYYGFAKEPDRELRRRWSLLVFALLAGGFTTKGPIALATFGLPVLAWTVWQRRWGLLRDHAWATGSALFAALTIPWFWRCELRNPGFLHYFFVNENFLRYVRPEYGDRYGNGHVYPRGTALGMMLVAVLPWLVCLAVWFWRRRGHGWPLPAMTGPASLFLLGVVLNTLFWCLGRQLLLTYMLPIVPMFCIWAALATAEDPPRWTTSVKPAAVMLAAVFLALAVAVPALADRRSTRGIVAAARERVGNDGTLIVARKVPYTAYFYAPELVLPHPKESVATSLARGLEAAPPTLFLVHARNAADIPPEARARINHVEARGEWHLYEPSQTTLSAVPHPWVREVAK